MENKIMLSDIFKIDFTKFKLHLAGRNPDGEHPLDYFIEDTTIIKAWNEWRGSRNDWTRDYIFSVIEYYPKANTWLFAGISKVIERKEDGYVIEACEEYNKYFGRLLFSFYRYQGLMGRAKNLENYIEQFEVLEIFPEIYTGEIFPGYENVNHDFSMLESYLKREKIDWKTALQNVKGIYLVTDKSNGKNYVGSAYGEYGIWQRWQCYIDSGHAGNDQLQTLITAKGIDYARQNFKFAILEILPMGMTDSIIIERETRWKNILMSKEYGYNSN